MTEQLELFESPTDTQPDVYIIPKRKIFVRHPSHDVLAMRRPFIAWDGEGYTDEHGKHHYWLLANSLNQRIIAPPGRSLHRGTIANFFHIVHSTYPNAIHSGFALGYDFTMMLRSNGISLDALQSLRTNGKCKLDGYLWILMNGKQLEVRDYNAVDYTRGSKSFLLQDSWGYFQRSFVKALDEYLGKNWKYRDTIIEMKQMRSKFDREHDNDVMRYNDMELELHVLLMEELRERLYNSGMPIGRWFGPGGNAQSLLDKKKIKSTLVDYYKEEPSVAAVAQFAYAGGRFELIRPGHANQRVYQYDINSAYPDAIRNLPNLAKGRWHHVNKPSWEQLSKMLALVRVRFNGVGLRSMEYDSTKAYSRDCGFYPNSVPFPLWRRDRHGNISYPPYGVHGWYWNIELRSAYSYFQDGLPSEIYKPDFQVEEAWIFEERNNGDRPFAFIEELYRNRQLLKKRGDGAHVGIKLVLNSLYGKFAQQIGWKEKDGDIIKPPYHNLCLAGLITAACRAKLMEAARQNPEAIIAFETDALFTTAKLDLPVTNALGDWELTEYDDMYYFASGFRYGIKDGEVTKPATRGIPVSQLELHTVMEQLTDFESSVRIQQTQFITLGWGYHMKQIDNIGNWRTFPKDLRLMCTDPNGKRFHQVPNCIECNEIVRNGKTIGIVFGWEGLHRTVVPISDPDSLNYPHIVQWNKLGMQANPLQEALFDENDEIMP